MGRKGANDEMKRRINKLYQSGLSCSKVGQIVGLSADTVGRYVENPRPPGIPQVMTVPIVKKINEYYNDMRTPNEIAAMMGLKKNTVSKHIWNPRPSGVNTRYLKDDWR